MEQGLASTLVYGNGGNQTVTHYYSNAKPKSKKNLKKKQNNKKKQKLCKID